MSKVRLGLVGCGNMAKQHASRFNMLGDRVVLTAAVDYNIESAEAVCAEFDGCRAFTDYKDIVDSVDAVLIAVPHHYHHESAKFFLEAGKHVLLEKPMANTDEKCVDLVKTAEKAEGVFMIAYIMRYHPLVARMKELLDAKLYGEVFQMSIWTEQLTQFGPDHWRASARNLGGGEFMSHGCHYVDILLWFLGRPIRGVHLGTNFGTPWMEKDGTSNAVIEFEGGRLGYHFGTWGARGTKLGYSFQAHCTEGMLEIDFQSGKLLGHKNVRGEDVLKGTETLMNVEGRKFTHNELAHFLDCIETGATPLTDAPGSLQGLRLIWRLYEAEEQGGMADLRGLGIDEYQGV